MKHLLAIGHKRIAFIGDTSDRSPEFKRRFEGYVQALNDAGIEFDPELQLDAETSEDSGYKAGLKLLADKTDFDAIFGASDLIAIGAMKALEEVGLLIPADKAVMGFDDIPVSAYTYPPLSTVRQNTGKAGELLVENLLALIAGESVESFLMPAELTIRGSCGTK